jgi:nucleotide-binding universal stress UspA family protein
MRIVVATDGSSTSLAALAWVAQLPLGADDAITIASAAQRPVLHDTWGYVRTQSTVEVEQTMWRRAQEAARQAVAGAASTIEHLPCPVNMVVAEGHPIDVLGRVAREAEADLLVVGPRGRGRLARVFLGSVSQGLLESMPVPVLVARRSLAPPARVLLATDGSSHGLAAARYLARFPLPEAARIHVLAVDDRSMGPQPEGREYWAPSAVDAAVQELAAGGVTSLPVIEYGYPQRKILATADRLESDLIVTGARGLGGFSGLILGSVSRAVSTAARCSVLVVGGEVTHST